MKKIEAVVDTCFLQKLSSEGKKDGRSITHTDREAALETYI